MRPTTLLTLTLLVAAGLLAALVVTGGAPAPAAAQTEASSPPPEGLARATFAGGCFWCMEPPFDKLEGVESTTSGYIAGEEKSPSYREVAAGKTGHTEAVEVVYDPDVISYQELLRVFWRNIDPLTADRQFCDWGSQYRTGIYFHDAEQERLARESKRELEQSDRFDQPIVTEVEPAGTFWVAEEYHQDYYRKNPQKYERYRTGCGRDARLHELWGDEAGGRTPADS